MRPTPQDARSDCSSVPADPDATQIDLALQSFDPELRLLLRESLSPRPSPGHRLCCVCLQWLASRGTGRHAGSSAWQAARRERLKACT